MVKTNAMRLLDSAKIKYDLSEYEVDEEKAKADVENFVAMLKENNLIEE